MPAGFPGDIEKRPPASGSLFGGVLVFQAQGADPPREAPVSFGIISIIRVCSTPSIRKVLVDT